MSNTSHTTITAKDLMAAGWQPGPPVGAALRAVAKLEGLGYTHQQISDMLAATLTLATDRPRTDSTPAPHADLEKTLDAARRQYGPRPLQNPNALLDAPAPLAIWGEDLLEEATLTQMGDALRVPGTVRAALLPDGHVGYGLPVGGVWALRNAVAPYAVGVDIACRMRLSLVPLDRGAEHDWANHDPAKPAPSSSRRERLHAALRSAILSETCFGAGNGFKDRLDHDVMDDPAWGALPPVIQRQKDRAHKQLGSSGGGNHFVEFGVLDLAHPVESLGLAPGRYIALMSHSGSRGFGHAVCDHYARLAFEINPLPQHVKRLSFLPLDTEAGQEYWLAMNLAGRYAAANHELIHQRVLEAAGLEAAAHVENHHNFAWKEVHDGEEVVVHRKGATPAGAGVLGVIPGSRETPGYLVEGLGNAASLDSASHGAGRLMSRTKAIQSLHRPTIAQATRQSGVDVISSGLDEAPAVYKDIEAVIAAQTDLIRVLGTFRPRIVRMADDGSAED